MDSKKVTVLVKKLHPEAKLPSRQHADDAGADVTAVTMRIVSIFGGGRFQGGRDVLCYGTGLAVAVPSGYWLDLCPRSSVYKTGLVQCNSIGRIDAGYRGEICQMFYADNGCRPYEAGDRIGQLIVQPGVSPSDVEFVEVDELPSENDRGGGFGSTGRK